VRLGRRPATATALWYGVLGLFILWAALSLTWPLGIDQGMLLWVGDVIRSGGMPYRDAFDIKGPSVMYAHALVATLFGRGHWGIRVFDLMFIAIGALLVARVAGRVAGTQAGRFAAAVFLLLYASLDFWNTAQADGWIGVLLAAVVALLMEERSARLAMNAAAAGGLIALAALGKPTYAMFGLLPLAYGVAHRDRSGRWVLRFYLLAALGCAATVGVCIAWFAARGALSELVDVHLRWTLTVYSRLTEVGPLYRARAVVQGLLARFGLLVPLALAGIAVLWRTRQRDSLVIAIWLALSVVNVGVQGRFWTYHWLPLFPVFGVLGGIALHQLHQIWREPEPSTADAGAAAFRRALPAALAIILLVALVLPPWLTIYRSAKYAFGARRGAEYQAEMFGAYGRGSDSFNAIAQYVRERTDGEDAVMVWGSVQAINFLSGRRTPTRFAEVKPFTAAGDTLFRPRFERELLEKFTRHPPVYVVALREGACGTRVPSGPMSSDHLAMPVRCLSELPALHELVTREYRLEREFGPFVVLRRHAHAAAGRPGA
jgi:hypothetical protein